MVRVLCPGIFYQPFGVKLFKGIWHAHPRFMNRTILVKDNDVDGAFHLLNRLMDSEGMLKIIRSTQYYQKPFMQRKAYSIAVSKSIYNEDMNRKFKFLMRKNRLDDHPGQMTT